MRTPLKYGDVIYPSEVVMDRVWEKVKHNGKEMLARGLLTEYAHNEAFDVADIPYQLTATTNVYDREVDGVWQDDKLATRNAAGELSTSHTISAAEHAAWLKQPDVISFRLLLEKGWLVPSKYDNTFFFARVNGLIGTRIANGESADDLYNRIER